MFNFGSSFLLASLLIMSSALSADDGTKTNPDVKLISYVSDTNKFGKESFTIKSDKSMITAFMTEVKIKKDVCEIISTFVFNDGIVCVGATILKTETGMTKFDFNGLELLKDYIDNKPDLVTAVIKFDLNSYMANLQLENIRHETQAILNSGKNPSEIFIELKRLNEKYIQDPDDGEKAAATGLIDCTIATAVYELSLLTRSKDIIESALCRMMVICHGEDPCGISGPVQ